MNSHDVMVILNEIAATSSRSEKENILLRVKDDPLIVAVLKATYDPFTTYGLTPPKVETDGTRSFDHESAPVWSTLNALAARAITGNEAKQTVLELMQTYNQAGSDLLWRILSKDLRAGFTANTINKVVPGLIPSFDVQLSHKFEEKRIKDWPVVVEPKLDGVRVICMVRGGKAQFFSRTGKPFPAVEHLGPKVVKMVESAWSTAAIEAGKGDKLCRVILDMFLKDKTVVLDGEIVSGSFNKTVGDVRRKDEAATDAQYHVFDALPLGSFLEAGDIAVPYKLRRRVVEFLIAYAADKTALQKTPRYLANSVGEIHDFYRQFRDRGLEGAIVKPREAPYQKKRSYGWLKMKAEESEDLRVVGAFEGTGKYEGMLGGLTVAREHDGNMIEVRVGGGFSDQQRREFWEAYQRDAAVRHWPSPGPNPELIGRMIEIEFHEVTPDGSLRHPRFVRFRDDKDEKLKEVA